MKIIFYVLCFTFFIKAQDGAWCWFSDPRAIYFEDKLFYGAVDSRGHVMIYSDKTYDLGFVEKDDHNNPSFAIFHDKLYCFYTKHNTSEFFMSLFTGIEWKTEKINFGMNYITYSHPNVIGDTLHLFFRGNGKTHHAKTTDLINYTKPVQILNSTYVKTATEDNRVHFITNEDHPMYDSVNSIYHFYYELGTFYRSNGKEIADSLPLSFESLTKVWQGGNSWIWDIRANGIISLAFASFTDRNEYYYAEYNNGWEVSLICEAGKGLYEAQPYYLGGIIICEDGIVASVEIEGKYYLKYNNEIIGEGIRPYYINGVLLYLSGIYNSYTNYQTEIIKTAWVKK